MATEIISASNISIGYKVGRENIELHSGLNLALRSGEVTALLGQNGEGKSTLLRTLAGLQPPLSGELYVCDSKAYAIKTKELAKKISIVLTEKPIASELTIYELISLGRQPHTNFWGKLTNKDKETIEKAISNIGLESKQDRLITELSDGELQKAMIAKALAQETPIIILDEPTAFLDVAGRIEIMELLHRIASTEGKTILLSTHDIEQALLWADNIWVLSKENGLICGQTEDMITSGNIEKMFDKSGIKFDVICGNFIFSPENTTPIAIETTDAELLQVCKRLLMRNGFIINHSAELKLIVKNRNNIKISTPRESHCFTNFYQLVDFIRKTRQ